MSADCIALSTQSVGVGSGMFHVPDRLLPSEPNLPSLVSGPETRRLNVNARVRFCPVLSSVSIRVF